MPEGVLAGGDVVDIKAPVTVMDPAGFSDLPRREPADPDAPFGYRADGTPRKSNSGRRPAADKARTTKSVPEPSEAKPASTRAAPVARDYTDELSGLASALWLGLAALPPTKGYAVLVKAQTPALVPAWNTAAQQNATIRRGVEYLTASGGTWIIGVAMASAPIAMGALALVRDPARRAELAAQTDRDLSEFLTDNGLRPAEDAVPAAA